MATVEQLRVGIQQELVKAETNFTTRLASLKERLDTQDNFDKDTQDTVAKLTERMGVFDTASSTFATQVSVNDAALKKMQALGKDEKKKEAVGRFANIMGVIDLKDTVTPPVWWKMKKLDKYFVRLAEVGEAYYILCQFTYYLTLTCYLV